jgi:cytochrome b
MSLRIYVWDALVRLFHWTLVASFTANAFFTDPEKSLHRYVGYGIATLLVFRLLWGLVGSPYARFTSFPPSPMGSLAQLRDILARRSNAHPGHSPLGALMIYNLLLTLCIISLSGYMMTTVAYFGIDWVKELHEASVTWAEISVAAHILAVFIESRRLRVNLPAAMITGYKNLP